MRALPRVFTSLASEAVVLFCTCQTIQCDTTDIAGDSASPPRVLAHMVTPSPVHSPAHSRA
jgi:hypothetical protein